MAPSVISTILCAHLILTMATTSSSSRNRDSGSRRNAPTGVSTPVQGSSGKFVTPSSSKTSKRGRESAATAVVPQRRSKRGHNNSAPLKLTASSQLFRNRDRTVTCFHFPLDPSNFDHLKVICSKCKLVLSEAKDGILTDAIKNKPRANKRICERPWDLDNEHHRETSKKQAYKDFHELFEEDASAVEEDNNSNPTEPEKKKRRRRTANNQQNNDKQERDAQPIMFGEDGHFTDDAVELLQSKLNSTPNDNDLRVVQMLMEWTSTSLALFDQDGHITTNTMKLFERRLKTSREDELNPNYNDLRVTGMLMKWTFESKDTKQYNAPVAVLPSFPHVKSIIVARVPQLNNSVEESTRLRNLRMKTLLARKFVYFCLQMHREESSCSIFWHRAGSIPRDN